MSGDLPFGFAAALVADQAHISNFSHASFSKEYVNFFFVGLHVDAGD